MFTATLINLSYNLIVTPSLPWAVIPIAMYAIGSAMAYPSINIMVMNLFPARRGMAASLSGFVTGMVNVLVAGLISPALSHSPVWLACGMACLMLTGLTCWVCYRRTVRRG
jgi:MFS transporter, DHA1 family, multidrug resistance protein